MGFSNPPVPWKELEATLSGRRRPDPGEDGAGWSRKRGRYEPPAGLRALAAGVPYAELHCHSNFSFLDGASHPEELAEEAVRLGLEALALTDHDGMYGVVRFAEAATALGLPTVFGSEITLSGGNHLLVLARDPVGYRRLCRAITVSHFRSGKKGEPLLDPSLLAAVGAGAEPVFGPKVTVGQPSGSSCDHWVVLTGCRKGAVPSRLVEQGPARAGAELAGLQELFGRDNVVVELWDHGDPLDSARNDALVSIADLAGAPVVATNNVHYHRPSRRRLATALAAVKARGSLDEIDGWLPSAATAHLRSGAEQARCFARYPGVVEAAAALGRECAFDLSLVAPNLPPWPVPEGYTEMSFLRLLTEEGAIKRYGPRQETKAWRQIDHELALIEQLDFPGYFLIVWDIVEFCQQNGILCQGRGSAACSAVCYVLGITQVDAVRYELLFERFLSTARADEAPDIDLDIESGRREEVIQYVYTRYGRGAAAQVANVITYRARSSVRDMGKALGASPGQLDAWAKYGGVPDAVVELATEVQNFPRHLGIHSGGMVICGRPVSEVCPVEWARMPGRTVLQWDKEDCARVGLVKFDLLGLGMLTVLHATVDHVRDFHQVNVDLGDLPQEKEVYDLLCRADTVGVFQVESRAQMATLPRLKPRTFYDLVIEVAIIRPGPIQGGSVHPYIRRANGQEEVTYPHPLLESCLERTKGVPLFQEQLMQMAIDVAGFTPAESDQLRQAMGSKRSQERMEKIRARLYSGMAEKGITGATADAIWDKLFAFANFGFPESHAMSFAYLVYASAWLKLHYPPAFCAGLLDGQPMGFWSPQTIVADARRHGVVVRRPDINASAARSRLEAASGRGSSAGESASAGRSGSSAGGAAVRLGLSYVRGLGLPLAERIVAERDGDAAAGVAGGGPYRDMEDLVRRVGLDRAQVEALATAGAFECIEGTRRSSLWAAGAVAVTGTGNSGGPPLLGVAGGATAPPLPDMTPIETNQADLWATGLSADSYPTEFARADLDAAGVVTAAGLVRVPADHWVVVAGVVTHRQRPATAQGVTFLNLEDETGLINVICPVKVWERFAVVANSSPALLVKGRLERVETVINIVAQHLAPLDLNMAGRLRSRDFR